MICDNIHYALQCCGTLNRFQYYTKADGDIEMMLWRPVGGTLYKLIGSVSDTVTGTDPNVGGTEIITDSTYPSKQIKFSKKLF